MLLVALAVLAATVIAGCDSAEQGRPSPSPSPSPTASVQAGLAPEPFPMPPDVIDVTSTSSEADQVRAQFEVSSSYQQLVDFFDQQLVEHDWEITSKRSSGDTTRYRIEGHGWTGAVTVFGGLDPVAFLIQLGSTDNPTGA